MIQAEIGSENSQKAEPLESSAIYRNPFLCNSFHVFNQNMYSKLPKKWGLTHIFMLSKHLEDTR